MKVWELTAPRTLELIERPLPRPTAGEVVVDVERTAVSPGTELHAYRIGPSEMMTALGYLAAGRVSAVGDGVDSVAVGTRVIVSAPHGSVVGVKAGAVHPIPDSVSADAACLTHLAGLGHACLHAGGYRPGDDVAVIGAGLVGMCAALVAEFSGARVTVFDVVPERLALPRRLGLGAALPDAATDGFSPAVIVDTSGSWTGLHSAARLARRGTRICVLGVNRRPPTEEVGMALFDELFSFPARFHYEGIQVIGCAGHPSVPDPGPDAWSQRRVRTYLLEAMAARRLDLGPLITERLDPGDLPTFMEALDGGDRSRLGAILDWSGAGST